MNTRLPALKHRRDLGQVRPPVHALEQDDVDLGEERLDAVDELDAVVLLDRRGELVEPVGADREIGAAALERGHDLDLPLRVRVQECLGELRHVRRVGADDAGPKLAWSPRRARGRFGARSGWQRAA